MIVAIAGIRLLCTDTMMHMRTNEMICKRDGLREKPFVFLYFFLDDLEGGYGYDGCFGKTSDFVFSKTSMN